MKDIKYNLNYIKKNVDIKKLLNFLHLQTSKNKDHDIYTDLIMSCVSKQNTSLRYECENFGVKKNDKWQPSEEWACEQRMDSKFDKFDADFDIHKSDKLVFNGTLLPKISKNFKLKFHFEFYALRNMTDITYFDIEPNNSHSLIESKINNRCYHIHCIRVPKEPLNDKKNIYVWSDFYVVSITKNKISTKRKFFEMIVGYNKKNKIHKFKRMYNSKNGNYLDMYNQNKV